MSIKKYVFLLFTFFNLALLAQTEKGTIVSKSMLIDGNATIQLKWYSQKLIYSEGVDIFRKEIDEAEWVKINSESIKKLTEIPETDDSDLEIAYQMASSVTSSEIKGIVLLNLMLQSFKSEAFAKFLGLYFIDVHVLVGKSYQYQVRNSLSNNIIAESDFIKAEHEQIQKAPEQFIFQHKRKQMSLGWLADDHYYGVNIYKSTSGGEFIKNNTFPIIITHSEDNKKKLYHYTDYKLKEKEDYKYYIKSLNYFGEESEASSIIEIKELDLTAPLAPLNLIKLDVKNLEVTLNWKNDNYEPNIELNIYRSTYSDSLFTKINIDKIDVTSKLFEDVVPVPDNYYYKIGTQDLAGNIGFSNTVFVEVKDVVAPSPPQNLIAIADTGFITLSWSDKLDKDIRGYRVYRALNTTPLEFALMNSSPISETIYIDSTVNKKNKNIFVYRVAALDSMYNVSKYSEIVKVQMPDITPPQKPYIRVATFDQNLIKIEWTPNVEKDLLGYNLYKSRISKDKNLEYTKVNVKTISATSSMYKDRDLQYNTAYEYILYALDSGRNRSLSSIVYSVKTPQKPVSAECNPTINLKSKAKTMQVNWNINTEQCGNKLIGYALFRILKDGSTEKLFGRTTLTTFTDKNSNNNTSYQVRAYFENGEVLYSNVVKSKVP